MFWLIVLGIIGAVVIGIANASANAKAVAAQRDAFLATHKGWEVYISPFSRNLIATHHESRMLAVGEPLDPQELSWTDLASVEIERDGQAITKTNRGSQAMGAAVGGLLLGPAGLLLGGLSGSKREENKIRSLALVVRIDLPTAPVHRIKFYESANPIAANSALIKPIMEQLEKFHALLANALRSEDNRRVSPTVGATAVPALTSEERIERLWKLHQDGALSSDEYHAAKIGLLTGEGNKLTNE